MQRIFDFFVDPLIWPSYIYLAGYGFVWGLAFFFARFFKEKGMPIERAANRAWKIGFVLHIIGGTILVIWLCIKAVPRVATIWYIPLYLLPYLIILVLDIIVLCFLTPPKRGATEKKGRSRKKTKNPRRSSK